MIGSAISAIGYFTGALEFKDALNDQARAKSAITLSLTRLAAVSALTAELGDPDRNVWGALHIAELTAAIKTLKSYVAENSVNDCRFTPPIPGPVLRKP